MSKYIRVIVIGTFVLSLLAVSHYLYSQSVVVQDGNIADLLAVKSNDEATNLFYLITRETASEYEKMGVTVSDYKVIDLDQDGRKELVLTLNFHSTGAAAPVLVIFAGEDSSSYQRVPGTRPYGKLDEAIVDLDHDGKMEIITAEGMLKYRGTRDPGDWPTIYSLHGTTYIAEESRFIEYYRNLATDLSQKIKQFELDNPLMDSDARNKETLKWLLPMYKALRITGANKEAGLEEAITCSNSSDIEWREVAVTLLEDMGSESALNVLVGMARDPAYPIRRRAIQILHKTGGIKFLPVYEELLSDPYYDTRTQSYPLRETARKYLRSYGITVVGSDGEYKIPK